MFDKYKYYNFHFNELVIDRFGCESKVVFMLKGEKAGDPKRVWTIDEDGYVCEQTGEIRPVGTLSQNPACCLSGKEVEVKLDGVTYKAVIK